MKKNMQPSGKAECVGGVCPMPKKKPAPTREAVLDAHGIDLKTPGVLVALTNVISALRAAPPAKRKAICDAAQALL